MQVIHNEAHGTKEEEYQHTYLPRLSNLLQLYK